MPHANPEDRTEYFRNYRKSERGKSAIQKYEQSEKAKARNKRWEQTETGQLYLKRKRKKQVARNKAKNRRIIEQAKDIPCLDCGGRFPSFCMDFHHVHGPKSFEPGRRMNASETQIRKEIAKCVVVCSNCHRIRHHATSN